MTKAAHGDFGPAEHVCSSRGMDWWASLADGCGRFSDQFCVLLFEGGPEQRGRYCCPLGARSSPSLRRIEHVITNIKSILPDDVRTSCAFCATERDMDRNDLGG